MFLQLFIKNLPLNKGYVSMGVMSVKGWGGGCCFSLFIFLLAVLLNIFRHFNGFTAQIYLACKYGRFKFQLIRGKRKQERRRERGEKERERKREFQTKQAMETRPCSKSSGNLPENYFKRKRLEM